MKTEAQLTEEDKKLLDRMVGIGSLIANGRSYAAEARARLSYLEGVVAELSSERDELLEKIKELGLERILQRMYYANSITKGL